MMQKSYEALKLEAKWRKIWQTKKLDTVDLAKSKKKYYLLVEFTYPSGDLHMGHWFAFAVPDILARYKRMNGFEVFAPNGFDAFGLPAENAAIVRGVHPKDWTYANIKRMKKQFATMGAIYDWEHEVITSDADYYRWNQWIFLKMFEKGLAYRGKSVANWCPQDQCVLANENVENGKCWRCGSNVVQKEVDQWFLKITEYADKLLWEDDQNTQKVRKSEKSENQRIRISDKSDSPKHRFTEYPEFSEDIDWPKSIREGQNNWIGRSEGVQIKFKISNLKFQIDVFTTRPDTLYGATFLVLAPEHELVSSILKWKVESGKWKVEEIKDYIEKAGKKSELERKEMKQKTGVFTGLYATNPASGNKIPVWVADYVLMGYGTGAIMAVPAHDQRDFEFAKKYDLPIVQVISQIVNRHPRESEDQTFVPMGLSPRGILNPFELTQGKQVEDDSKEFSLRSNNKVDQAYLGPGVIVNSGDWNSIRVPDEISKVVNWLEQKGICKRKVQYHLHDWSISRQRYWGTPFPIIYCSNCWGTRESVDGNETRIVNRKTVKSSDAKRQTLNETGIVTDKLSTIIDGREHAIIPVPYKDLPVELPYKVDFNPKGKPPLATAEDWVKVKCPNCGQSAKREVETMDTFVDSAWYFLSYLRDTTNRSNSTNTTYTSNGLPWDPKLVENWMPVDIYFGGAEHTLGHTLYSRFFVKFLQEIGAVHKFPEYAKKRVNHGVILGPDGSRMSKSRGNVVNPDMEVKKYGADAVRLYLAFLGPYDLVAPWNPSGIRGIHKFLWRVWRLVIGNLKLEITRFERVSSRKGNLKLNEDSLRFMHKTIKKVSKDIEANKFNTAIAALMSWLNELEKRQPRTENNVSAITHQEIEVFLLLLAPFAPYICEELYQVITFHTSRTSDTFRTSNSVHAQPWPKWDPKLAVDEKITLVIQVNGRVRDTIQVPKGISQEDAQKLALESGRIQKYLRDDSFRTIFVVNRLINFVLG